VPARLVKQQFLSRIRDFTAAAAAAAAAAY
jgi:hypothetical protein